jgi:CubicO group peptidase (beta-lactamase class C family)
VTRIWAILALALVGILSVTSAGEKRLPVTGRAAPNLASFDALMTKFVRDNDVPGAALAVTKDGRLVYARGFGYADRENGTPVRPKTRFRIASISKPITAAAILRLVMLGKLKLDERAFELLGLADDAADPRLKEVTIRELLHHTGGWDRAVSFDPMFRPLTIAKELNVAPPAGPESVLRYMRGQKLDFAPGSRYAYSNFGYCVLGRVIEKVTGQPYEKYVRQEILAPLGIHDMEIGKTLAAAKGEVHYIDEKNRQGRAVLGPNLGKPVPLPYGAWYLEAMDAHGGWIASAPDLVRFASAFDRPEQCKILNAAAIGTMFARPPGPAGLAKNGKPSEVYYGCGWQVRVVGPKALNTWHTGALDGTATILVRRHDGLCWAVLFNTRANARGESLTGLIDGLVHEAADAVKHWPKRDLFDKGG